MEIVDLSKQDESLPTLIRHISSNEVAGFDSNSNMDTQYQPSGSLPLSSSATGIDTAAFAKHSEESQPINHQRTHSISISMPNSPIRHSSEDNRRVPFEEIGETILSNGIPVFPAASMITGIRTNKVKFLSQPMPKGYAVEGAIDIANLPYHPSLKKLKDKRYDSFKTWSGKFERQLSHLRGKPREDSPENSVEHKLDKDALPVDRYYDALEGPELENLRASEEIVLPDDKTWPFLLRFPISSFGICLGVSSQAIMWKTMATSPSTKFLHVSPNANLVLWCISLALLVLVACTYMLKMILYFEAVRREYYHPIRVNFFFAPWIALLFLALGVPPSVTNNLPACLWYILMTPFLCLELKIYGQWMSGGQRRLSKVANPSNHLSVVGNFVGALLGASMGLKEGPIFFFAVGLAHYTVLFVTLYQRLPTNETLPKELHPVFFLFVAAPSVASMAWAKIQGSFDYGSRIAYFIALFLYFSLAVRINFFRGFKFSLAWWAYTFPMTGAAIATIRYSNEVTNVVTQILEVLLCAISTLIVTALLVTTIIHAFVLRDLFPNDLAIAISDRKPKHHNHLHHIKWLPHGRLGSSEKKEIENYLKYATSDCNDIEASTNHPSSEDSK
ncbi:S-type anion channel SLAH2 [Ricinus communis]|uniref:Tellurite resistance protein tehA, putative n=1 Tax=Ricinus communis TaxID=3988 RepID=B9RIQ3_RICCO|nr:S-type anion channel SLAH2 [Ricinus communis]XP_015571114.1 S-type anion channel SLAH2 [Ricinus communis]EEF49025.1 Tellurite resistance protein tehA, putative [Ricinus communis]|eukprot:XP_002513622.1 S-type anion channel SLAH2 [Ricinus communis]